MDTPASDVTAPPVFNSRFEPGEMVVISLLDGANVAGKLALFNPQRGIIEVAIKGKEEPVKIPLASVQMMHLPTAKTCPPHADPPAIQPFCVTFIDGSEMKGEAFGAQQDHAGVHIFPKYSANKYQRSFIPFSAMQTGMMGGTPLNLPKSAKPTSGRNAAQALTKARTAQMVTEYLKSTAVTNPKELEQALVRQKSMPHMKLGEILISEKLVNEAQLQSALSEQKSRKGIPLGELLVEKGVVTTAEIQQSLAKKLGIPFVKLGTFEANAVALKLVPRDIADKHCVAPIHFYHDKIVVALENPMNWDALDALRFHTNTFIEPVMATEEDIRRAIQTLYTAAENAAVTQSIDELTDADTGLQTNPDEHHEEESDVSDNVIVKLLNTIIVDAQRQGSSDIHIEPAPGKDMLLVRFRKDGDLVPYHELPSSYKGALISRIKILAKLDISEKRRPQDGKIEFKKSSGEKLELRVAIIPTVGGQEDVVMRILAGGKPLPVDQLALSERNLENIKRVINTPYGLFLVCGPTGSGKTTTLHSILGSINKPDTKIWTAEDPVEITQKGLRQVQVNSKIGLDFATAMRAFLRADPDVIMVGEMRDKETVHTGIEASLTGHLVFSTLHTNSAPESVVRLLDMGMDPFNFADALLGILAQRLARRLCPDCKQAYTPTDDEMNILVREYCAEMVKRLQPDEAEALYQKTLEEWRTKWGKNKKTFVLYKPKGCLKCDNTGYRGRIGLHELLIGTDAVKHDILNKVPISQLLHTALNEGMRTLRQDGIEKVVQGITDIHQIHAVCSK